MTTEEFETETQRLRDAVTDAENMRAEMEHLHDDNVCEENDQAVLDAERALAAHLKSRPS